MNAKKFFDARSNNIRAMLAAQRKELIPDDLRVAKLYPERCTDSLPFNGVPTEQLARQATINRKAFTIPRATAVAQLLDSTQNELTKDEAVYSPITSKRDNKIYHLV